MLLGTALAFATRAGAQAPPPPPVPNPNATPVPALTLAPATPSPTPTPAPHGRHREPPKPAASGPATPTPTPTSPAFATLDGTWEVQVQYIDKTLYSYFDLKQSPSGELTGRWRRDGKLYPLEGSYDGRNFKMVVTTPNGDYNLSGFVEAASDMIGLIDDGKGKDGIPFTAEHRAAQSHNFLNHSDVSPGGGGMPGGGGPH